MTLPIVRLLAPAPFAVFQTQSTSYTADNEGRINANSNDLRDLLNAGCLFVGDLGTSDFLMGTLIGANFNTTADQIIPLPYLPAGVNWRCRRITVRNASTSMTTAAGGVYTNPSKTAFALVAAAQAYTALTVAISELELTFNLNLTNKPATKQLYFSLTTAQGAVATADIYVYGEVVF